MYLHAWNGFSLVSKIHNAASTPLSTAVQIGRGIGEIVCEAPQELAGEDSWHLVWPAIHKELTSGTVLQACAKIAFKTPLFMIILLTTKVSRSSCQAKTPAPASSGLALVKTRSPQKWQQNGEELKA